ncbi:MAG: VOC family protein [Dehalococcoidia bacterium]|nr:VOC family protein [Dehalococcoidia bacterium]
MGIQRVGHAVIRMRDLEKAKWFYHEVLGMEIGAETDLGIFFRFGNYHHDLAVFYAAPDGALPNGTEVGLDHLALLADNIESVRAIYDRAKAMGVEVVGSADHAITRSLYLRDPEGNKIEVYVDVPEYNWREEGMGGILLPFDIEDIPSPAATH